MRYSPTLTAGVMLAALACALMLVAGLNSCTDEDGARRALKAHGFSKVQLRGWAPFDCDSKDFSSTKFTAVNPSGARVSGVVCCGVLKACTVRF